MSQFDRLQNTNSEKPDWSELDADPVFQENLLVNFRILILEKKFGQEFFEENKIIPEAAVFGDELRKRRTVEEMLTFAHEENIEITSEDLAHVKTHAVEFMVEDAQ